MNKEKISVLMPVYNREKYISLAITSILKQTYKNIELIIFDDGSRDQTVAIIRRFMQKDNRIKLIRGEKNNGVAYARNQLIDALETDIVCWQDSDDMSNINKLQMQYDVMDKTNNCLIFTNYKIYNDRDFKEDVVFSNEWTRSPIIDNKTHRGMATLMFRLDRINKFNENKRLGGEDVEWFKNIPKTNKIIILNRRLYYIRFHEDRIGIWKRKLRNLSGFTDVNESEIEQRNMTYEEMIENYKIEKR